MRKSQVSMAAALLLLVGAAACTPSQSPEETQAKIEAADAAVSDETQLISALIYAEWCGSCKVLDPRVQAIEAANTDNSIAFVTLDYTAKDTDAFYATAKAAGIEEGVRTVLGDTVKTGQLLLIDKDDQSILAVIGKDMAEADMAETISAAARVAAKS